MAETRRVLSKLYVFAITLRSTKRLRSIRFCVWRATKMSSLVEIMTTIPIVVTLSYLTLRQTSFFDHMWKSFNSQLNIQNTSTLNPALAAPLIPPATLQLNERTSLRTVSPDEELHVR